jgi:outer membrane receptor for ferrienterochelin and colicins
MFKQLVLTGFMSVLLAKSYGQNAINGVVYSQLNGKQEALAGAVVGWVNTSNFVLTDSEGRFEIETALQSTQLFASFVGFVSDTVDATGIDNITFTLKPANVKLEEVTVRDRQQSAAIKKRDANLTQLITTRELAKAACCNLSESFETNPAIDASFTDAVTGTRQIRLLGLDGPYSYYTRGNIPTMWGIASVLGLQLIPGSWIQSIQLTKGSGSVLNGFESVAGQVNYELRPPDGTEKLFVQLYGNAGGRLEQSVVLPVKINDAWSTNVMVYGRQQVGSPDFNNDGFLDMPQGNLLIAQNAWKYRGTNGWETQFGIKYAFADQTGGELDAPTARVGDTVWRVQMNTNRFEYWHKLGYVFKDSPYRSIGMQWMFNWHDQQSDFGAPGVATYAGEERDLYFNLIFQDIIKNTDHNYKLGLSYKQQSIDEIFEGDTYLRREQIPGLFAEYTYLYLESFTLVAGLRADHHSQYGSFITPRLHVRWAPTENHTFRANAGKAYRTPNLFSDNMGVMAGSRQWDIQRGDEAIPYNGLQQEESLNAGISYVHTFTWDYRPGSFRIEYFYTDFQNQLVKDWDESARQILFYNLNGRSRTHNAQVQFDWEVIQRLNLRLAYRYVDARTTYKSIGFAQQPFIDRHRFFVNMGYESVSAWRFDATFNWHSPQRLPTTASNTRPNQRDDQSPAYATLNVLVAKTFWKRLEVHVGAENILDYRQPNPIVSADDPFSNEFDASMVWGPIMGRVLYGGIRLSLF